MNKYFLFFLKKSYIKRFLFFKKKQRVKEEFIEFKLKAGNKNKN